MDEEIEDSWEDRREDPGRPSWEIHAREAVKAAWEGAEFDDVRGTIGIIDSDEPRHKSNECKNLDELTEVLSSIYIREWYAYVPFENGEAVFDDYEAAYVESFLWQHTEAGEFFNSLHVEDSEEDLFQSDEVVEPSQSHVLRLDLTQINEELIRRLASQPELMRVLDPRKFEELVAELLRDKGYEVTLTPRSRDGGRDIIAIKREDIGSALTLVECKRYAGNNKVGVDVVRGLYGVVEVDRATKGLVATTSYFTKDAKVFRDKVPYRLGLADFDVLRGMLAQFRSNK
ncbi:MAG: restriction endonuclease [Nitrospirales bacterium]|nr:restriction endonuclease [Nitrospirales bacterium]